MFKQNEKFNVKLNFRVKMPINEEMCVETMDRLSN